MLRGWKRGIVRHRELRHGVRWRCALFRRRARLFPAMPQGRDGYGDATTQHAPDVAQRLRLAYLYGVGQTVAEPEDTASVAAAAAALPAPPSVGRTGPWLVAALSALVLALGAGGLWLRHALRPFVPLETPVGNLLGDKLADYAVALSRHDAAGAQTSRDALSNPAAGGALGPNAVQRMSSVLSSMQALYATSDTESRPRIDAFQNAVTGLDSALEAGGLPYFVDAEMRFAPEPQPLPMSYYVQRETHARAEGQRHRVVRLWRLDNLGVAQALLGFTRPHTPAAIVLLDQIESDLNEVQHRLDYARGLIPVPAFLCGVLGLENPLDAAYGTLAARSRDEASAYLAEVARTGDSPLLDVVILAHFMLDRRQLGSPYSYAALEVYAALGKALGINVEALLGRSISRERFARLAEAVWEHSPAELRDAAQRAYAADFGAPLPEVSFDAARDNPYYRPDRAP